MTIYPIGSYGAYMGQQIGRHQGPPPEAYQACTGKNVGDTSPIPEPRGDTVTGTCAKQGNQLVLRPNHPRPGRQDNK